MHVCMYVCIYVRMCVCVCAKVVVIKARGNVAVDLKLMMCSSGYCVWLEAIDTHTCTYTLVRTHTNMDGIYLLQ